MGKLKEGKVYKDVTIKMGYHDNPKDAALMKQAIQSLIDDKMICDGEIIWDDIFWRAIAFGIDSENVAGTIGYLSCNKEISIRYGFMGVIIPKDFKKENK